MSPEDQVSYLRQVHIYCYPIQVIFKSYTDQELRTYTD
jgi:hypothetical protein